MSQGPDETPRRRQEASRCSQERGRRALLLCVVVASTGVACAGTGRWTGEVGAADRAPLLYGVPSEGTLQDDIDSKTVPEIPAPKKLRPCCAFGTGLHVNLGKIPVPGVELQNVIAPEDLGPHTYDNGLLSLGTSQSSGTGLFGEEHNGLVLTCRGGFIDTAHLRDYADWTLFLAAHFARSMDEPSEIPLHDEGGKRRIVTKPFSPELIEIYGRRRLATEWAAWMAFRLSIWHEVATWYGWSALEMFPELASAFSPEDLYSNMLGVRISAAIIEAGSATTERRYNHAMDHWIEAVLVRLHALPLESAREAMHVIDGLWWDSQARLPAKNLVLRRNMDIGPEIDPWRAGEAIADPEEKIRKVREHCGESLPALQLPNPSDLGGIAFSDYATLEIEISENLLAAGFPLPRPDSRIVTQDDLPWIIEQIRAQNAEEFGPDSDQPRAIPADD